MSLEHAFNLARTVEEQGMAALVPFLRVASFRGQFVLTAKGPLSQLLQETMGDVLLNCSNGKAWAVEIKCEESNKYKNFFLETWSNKKFDRRKPGWMYTNLADMFWFYFIKEDELYVINGRKLYRWAHEQESQYVPKGTGRLYDFEEKRQNKYVQANNTCGRCVPIRIIQKEVGFNLYHPMRHGLQQAIPFPLEEMEGELI